MNVRKVLIASLIALIPLVIGNTSFAKDLSTNSLAPITTRPLVPLVSDPSIPLMPRVPPPKNVNFIADPSRNLNFLSNAATFSITFVPAGQSDTFGEPCYEFPVDAQAAYTAAANIWSSILQSSVPITIRACWADFQGSVLGYSGGGTLHANFTGAPQLNTVYTASLANSFAGIDIDTSNEDMHLTFNRNFNWYYGIDGQTPSNQSDLVTVALHEIGHGLGFSGSADYFFGSGSWGYGPGYPDIYDTYAVDGGGNNLTDTTVYPNPSSTLGVLLTSNDLWFNGVNAKAANNDTNVQLYAPNTWSGGSSFSHLDYSTFNNTVNQLMVYAVSAGESIHDPGEVGKGLLKDLGWVITSAVTEPIITTPTSGSTLPGTSATFQLDNGVTNVTTWALWVGSSIGTHDYGVPSTAGSNTSITANNLPTDGSPVYIRLWYKNDSGTWIAGDDYSYVAATSASPNITSPVPGSTLPGTSVTFELDNAGVTVTTWALWVGSSLGAKNFGVPSTAGANTSITANNLPTDGSPVYIRLWYKNDSGSWIAGDDYTYDAATSASPNITSPALGSTLPGTSATFELDNAGVTVTTWALWVGSSLGANNYGVPSTAGTNTSITANNLPTDGSPVYIRLWYKNASGSWIAVDDYIYDAATSASPNITSPAPGSILPGASATFELDNAGVTVTTWALWVGSSLGAQNYGVPSTSGTNTSITANNLPTDGSFVYIRLWYKNASGSWIAVDDYVYEAFQ